MRQLPHLHARIGDRIQPARRQSLVSLEQPIDRIILLHISLADVEKDNAAVKREGLGKQRLRQIRVERDRIELIPVSRSKHIVQFRLRRKTDIGRRSGFMTMPTQRLGNSGL